MFLRAENGRKLDAVAQGGMLCMYSADLPALQKQLIAAGVKVPSIGYSRYLPSGEINLVDPDGCHIAIGHWGEKEHQA